MRISKTLTLFFVTLALSASFLTNACSSNSATAANTTSSTTVSPWIQQAYIKAVNADADDQFGYAVALDGDTLVVGAMLEDSDSDVIINGTTADNGNTIADAGAVYVYRRSGTSWTQEAYLKAPNSDDGDRFGEAVAISGDTIVVGASCEESNQTTITNGTTASTNNSLSCAGAAYVFKRTGTTWAQQAYIKAPNPDINDRFGISVAISGDTIAVGARGEDSNQVTITNGTTASTDNSKTDSGAVYVYKRTGTNWAQEAYIKAANADANDFFGYAVSLSGDTIAVGARSEDSNQTTITNGTTASADNSKSNSGAVYVYKRTGTNWAQEAYIKAANADSGDDFGAALALDGDTLAVTAPAESSNQTTVTNGNTASSDNSLSGSGAVYVYKRTGTAWAQEAYIKAPNARASYFLGESVALQGNRLVVGSVLESSNQTTNSTVASTDNSAPDTGAAYVFERSGSSWAFSYYLKAPNAEAEDRFAFSVAVSGSTIAIGAPREDSNQTTITNGTTASADNSKVNSGAVYVMTR